MWEQFNQSGSFNANHLSLSRWGKGKYVEDESYEWNPEGAEVVRFEEWVQRKLA